MSTFIDIHILQTVPSSNMNRDDTGRPKTAIFGGVPRARVSSQAWKRATRNDFGSYLSPDERGVRTRRIVEELVERIRKLDDSLNQAGAIALAKNVMTAAGVKFRAARAKKDAAASPFDLSEYLLFVSNQQLDRLARLAVDAGDDGVDKAAAKKAIDSDHGIEVALFGRMVADDTSLNVDASVQVAHAISTHVVEPEYDYYTAVDDRTSKDDEDAGAGMIGVIEFNSSTLYRYATIDLTQLMENLGDAQVAGRAVEAFARSFVVSLPIGKQNSFAHGTLPDAVVAQVRDRRPVNLVGAFELPIRPDDTAAISTLSARALARRAGEVEQLTGTPIAGFVVAGTTAAGEELADLGEPVDLDTLSTRLRDCAVETLGASS